MMYAETASGRAEASPGLEGTCPSCGHPCRPKCGQLVTWHWADHARADCDPWSEPMTEWNLGWQRAVPPERREVVMGPHLADIMTASGGVVEIQYSSISADMITEREEFYGDRMAWIFDARAAAISRRALAPPCDCTYEGCQRLGAVRQAAPWATVLFRWYSPRRSITACRRPVFIDLGRDGILRLPWPFMPYEESPGALYTRSSVEGWLKDGTQLDRITPPPVPTPCAGARPFAAPAIPPPRHRVMHDAVPPPQSSRRRTADRPIGQWEMAGEWLDATCRIVPEVGMEACLTLWRAVIEKYRRGELAEADAVKVLDLLKARMEALKDARRPVSGADVPPP